MSGVAPPAVHLEGMSNIETIPSVGTMRLIHGAQIAGLLLFVTVLYFVIRPQMADQTLPPIALNAMLGVSVTATIVSLSLLRSRVPLKSTDETADLYWTRATGSALIVWVVLEGAALLAFVAYMFGGVMASLAAAAVALFGLVVTRPGYFEQR